MKRPPQWIDSVLESVLKDRFADEVIGDLHEWYAWKQEVYSERKLTRTYCWNALRAIRLHQLKKVKNLLITILDTNMVHSNIRIGIRSLLQNRFFTSINVLGLTISLVSFLLIFAYIKYEKSYNDFHPKGDQIYRILRVNPTTGFRERPMPSPLANAFLHDYEGMMEFARFGQDPVFVELEDQKFYESDFYWGDPSVIEVFDLPFVYGNPAQALVDKNTVVITQSVCEKYFGKDINPIGQSLPIKIYDGDVNMLMRIDGVIEDLPGNSDLPFELLGSMSTALELYSRFNDLWWLSWMHVYVHIPEESDLARIKAGVPAIITRELGEDMAAQMTFEFQPLNEVHLYSEDVAASLAAGSIRQVNILTVIAILILLIASINYLNLVNARISRRRQEVGIRRVMGANGSQILGQLFTESTMAVLFSFVLALVVTWGIWPSFVDGLGKEIPLSILLDWDAVFLLGVVLIVVAVLSGLYPAWLATSIRTKGLVDKKTFSQGKRFLQKGLVTFQFAIAVFLVVSSVLIFRQVHFMTQKDLGFDQEHLVTIKVEDKALQEKINVIRKAMSQVPGVKVATASGESLPSDMNNGAELYWGEMEDEHHFVYIVAIDELFFDALKIPMLQGENFTPTSDPSLSGPIIVNRAAAKLMKTESPLDVPVRVLDHQRSIIGVAEDYHYASLKNQVQPTIFVFGKPGFRESPDNIILRLFGNDMTSTINQLEDVWNQFSKNELFQADFVDESYARLYESDQRFLTLFTVFSILSILIACLGLYGIVLFTTEERSKEISIRKVLGSSVSQVAMLVSRKFVFLIALGLLIGLPASLYFIEEWLVQFSYQLEPEPMFILLSLLLVFMIAAITIGLHTLRAAHANPVKYLRDE